MWDDLIGGKGEEHKMVLSQKKEKEKQSKVTAKAATFKPRDFSE